jgi:hypothetical protein
MWPIGNLEEGSDVGGSQADHHGVGTILELGVAHVVVAVAMGMGHDQGRRGVQPVDHAPVLDQSVDGRPDLQPAGAGVEQQDMVLAEQQIEEGAFEIGADRLADDIGVGVILLDLHLGFVGGNAVDPGGEERGIGEGGGGRE